MSFSFEERGPVACIRFDDGKANVFNPDSVRALEDVLARAETAGARAVVLTGRSGMFSAGLDLKVVPALPQPELKQFLLRFFGLVERVALFPKPVVLAATGHMLAGGCVLGLACDIRVGADGPFRVGLNETRIRVALPSVVLALGALVLPASVHAEVMLHGRIFLPAEARQRGIFDEVVPPEKVLDQAIERAAGLAECDARAYLISKLRLRQATLERAAALLPDEVASFFGE
jgi:enoyl-CoA hydratase